MSEWLPIESAPMRGEEIILGHPEFGVSVGYWKNKKVGWIGWDLVEPTHWQPLPAPPEK